MADNILTPSKIAGETLRILHNNSAFLGNVSMDLETEWKTAPKPGSTVSYRRPVQFTVRSGATANLQDVNETSGTLVVQPEIGIDWDFSEFDMKLSLEEFSKRYLMPAGMRLASELDYQIGQRYLQIANHTGTPGTLPGNASAILNAGAVLDESACPRDGQRYAALTPRSMASVVNGLSGFFNDTKTTSEQNKTGLMKTNLGMDFFLSQNLPTHTVGPLGGTPLSNGATQGIINSGATDNPYAATSTIVTDGWTAAAALRLNAGDVINFAGVFAVNPETRQSTGILRDFVVTAAVSSDAGGNASIIVSPAVIAGGSYQNVTQRVPDNSAITVKTGAANTAYPQNMIWHKDAISMVSFPMDVPKGMDMASQASYDGVSLRFVRGYDILNNRRICRFDMLYGAVVNRPEWTARLTA
jgi:hypothetical protein